VTYITKTLAGKITLVTILMIFISSAGMGTVSFLLYRNSSIAIINNQTQMSAESVYNFGLVMLLLVIVSCVLLGAICFWHYNRVIGKPIKGLSDIANNLAVGNLDINNLPLTSSLVNLNKKVKPEKAGDFSSYVPNDEIGQLTVAVFTMTDVIKSLISEFLKLEHEVDVNGDTKYRINSSKYSGAFHDICERGNTLVEQFNNDLFLVFDILAAIGDGNFDVDVRQLPGEKAAINHFFNFIVSNLRDIHNEITRLFQSLAEGNLDLQADTDKYQGGWAELLKEMNNLAATVADPISEIEVALTEMAKGNFETPVKGDYKGAFNNLKQTVNKTGFDLLENVNEITTLLQALAKGDLTVPVNRNYIGSYTTIKKALISIFESLNRAMWTIQNTATQVQENASQMSESSASLAEGTNRQSYAIQRLNESLETINEKTHVSAETAQSAKQRSLQSTDSAQSGRQDMQEMISVIEGIKDSSTNITKIIGVIRNISFQTNLLALNASVEAARAGEHGKGFSVVAEEVRNLAARSQTATKDTTAEIDESMRRIDEGIKAIQSTATSLDTILNHVNEVSTLISHISDMAQEQADAIDHINQGLTEISQVVQENSAASQEYAATSQELSSQAENLKQAVAFFTVRPPRESYNNNSFNPQ